MKLLIMQFSLISIHFISLQTFIQGFCPGPMLRMNFRNKLIFYGEELLAPRPTPKLEDHPLSAVHGCLFRIFASNTPNLEVVFFTCNLRTRHAMVASSNLGHE
jgi:hypothetical protein